MVNVKDTFTRIAKEHESERKARIAQKQAEIEKISKKKEDVARVKGELFSLFSEKNRQKRGKALEKVLNSLFQVYKILIREAFTLTGDDGEGVVEQIDGVIEIDGHLYFIEMKWWEKPIGGRKYLNISCVFIIVLKVEPSLSLLLVLQIQQ